MKRVSSPMKVAWTRISRLIWPLSVRRYGTCGTIASRRGSAPASWSMPASSSPVALKHGAPVMSPFVGPLRTTRTCNGLWLNSLQQFSSDALLYVTGSPYRTSGHLRPTGHDVPSSGTTLHRSRHGSTAYVYTDRVCHLDSALPAARTEWLAGLGEC